MFHQTQRASVKTQAKKRPGRGEVGCDSKTWTCDKNLFYVLDNSVPQTLLHEMIHALLFVTQNNRDRDGHGPEFCKHMNRINKASGTKITVSPYFTQVNACRSVTHMLIVVSDFSPPSFQVYHSFHDEVDVYRQHWWRCNGPCQNRKPYFGYVKRAMNRAPSALDPWWEDHRRTCGGTYVKVKEPEGYGKKGKKDAKKEGKNLENKTTGNAKTASAGAPIIPLPLALS